ncbi:hypothetical protein [Mesorhizobium erdmanii]|uniref:hypothetical protein n=1 Tax=Mesorhizobium erdmanii TaxID=1777866 RepID=UPI0012B5F78D|nr:hypothetical protein [Mesorhizobium erdmanii]
MTVESRPLANANHHNLVIVRAGDNSLHRGWGAADPGRGFDLIVIFDALPVRHTRPVGIHVATAMPKSGRTAEAEYQQLALQYRFGEFFPLSYEAVDRKGRLWRSRPIIGLRMVANYAVDRNEFRQARRLMELLWRLPRRQCFKPADLSQMMLEP